VIDVGRRDLFRRERAKLAVAASVDVAADPKAAAQLPAWLGTGQGVLRRGPVATDAGQARPPVGPTSSPMPAPQRATRARRSWRSDGLFVSAPLLELVQMRAQARAVVRELDAQIADAVQRARAAGALWSDIAIHLGVTRQGARQRYGGDATQARQAGRSSTDPRIAAASPAARY
jgi:hypothetical protein